MATRSSSLVYALLVLLGCGRLHFETSATDLDSAVTDAADASNTDSSVERTCLLFCAEQLSQLPTSGAAWEALLADATGDLGSPNLASSLDTEHAPLVFALALVAVRLDDDSLRERARAEIMRAVGTEEGGHVLSVSRALPAYIYAADLIELQTLSPEDDATFRAWLNALRTRELGGHSRWTNITFTHGNVALNWGAYAGLARIAASRYLGDNNDVSEAANIFYGFLGDRAAYAGFIHLQDYTPSWTCDEASWTPINPPCERSGINVDGAAVESLDSISPLTFPAPQSALEAMEHVLRAMYQQAWLLHVAGYPDPFEASERALLRAVDFLFRNEWNQPSMVHRVLPWFANAIYGTSYPTFAAAHERSFGYSDWLAPLFSR